MGKGAWLRLVWLLMAVVVAAGTLSAQSARVTALTPQGVTVGAFPSDPLPVFFVTDDFVLAPVGPSSGFRAYWNVQGGTQLSISGESGNVFGEVFIPPALRSTVGSYPIIICNFVNLGGGPIEDCTNPATSVLFNVNPPPSFVTPSTLPPALINSPYSTQLVVTGGTPGEGNAPYLFELTAGSLPPGISLNSTNGNLTGTPTVADTFNFTVAARDTSSVSTSRTFSLEVRPPLSILTSSPLPSGAPGVSYSATLQGAGGIPPFAWRVAAGNLPPGLALDPATGSITGFPSTPGTSSFSIQLDDTVSAPVTRSFQLTIVPELSITTTAPLPAGTVQSSYNTTLAATGGTTPYVWSLSGGSLPPGLSLSTAGVLSGTPTTAGDSLFQVRVTDDSGQEATRNLTISIIGQLEISTAPPLPPATRTLAYSTTIAGQGGFTPYQWTVFSGALPAGLTLSPTTGVISGTPTTAGTSNFGVRLTDAQSNTAERNFQIAVAEPLAITTVSPLQSGIIGASYSATLAATGGNTPYTWSVASGTLPAGLSLSTAGVLSGTPTTGGSFNFEVRVTDADSREALRNFTVAIGQELLISTAPPLPVATRTVAYSTTIAGQGGFTPYQWTVYTGALPAGLALNESTGVISGTPTTAGTSNFGVRLTDARSNTAERNFQIAVAEPLAITTVSPLQTGVVNTALSLNLVAEGGTGPYQWELSGGSLPPGLGLDSAGVLSGTPTTVGSYSFEARVSDSENREATRSFTMEIEAALVISTASPLPPATRSESYSVTLAAEGGLPPYQWQVVSGVLPAGVALDEQSGVLSGSPADAGSFSFAVRVSDSGSNPAERTFELQVAEPLEITTVAPLPRGTQQVSYSLTLAGSGGVSPYLWEITGGSLPSGLQLDTASGQISGVPTEAGTFNITVQLADQDGREATSSFEVEIAQELQILTEAILAQGITGEEYTASLEGSGGTTPYAWSVAGGSSLPPGLSLNAATGLLSGTPAEKGDYSFTIELSDALEVQVQRSFSLLVLDPLVITTLAVLPGGAVTEPYAATLEATGGLAPLTWSLAEGTTLPDGLILSGETGALSGTPSQSGEFMIGLVVTDDQGTSYDRSFTLDIVEQPEIVTETPLPGADEGEQYTFVIAASGGRAPYQWQLGEGSSLPAGLSLNPESGLLSGIPTESEEYQFSITVVDSEDRAASKNFTLVVTPTGPPPTILTETLPEAIEGTRYEVKLAFSGGAGAVTFSLAGGSRPPGIDGPSPDGEIIGVPGVPGEYTFRVRAEDVRQQTDEREYTLVVRSNLELLTSSPLPAATVGQGFQATLQAQGGVAPYTYMLLDGAVPEGLAFRSEGVIAGTPSSIFDGTLRVRLSDSSNPPQTIERDFALRVSPPLLFVTASLENPVLGQPYTAAIAVEGGQPDYSFSVVAGTVPTGLALDPQGQLSGDAAATGTVSFTVLVEDQDGRTAERVFTLLTAPALLRDVDVFLETPDPEPNAQEPLIVEIAEDAEADLEGELRMEFAADTDPPVDDPAIQFITGGRTAAFTIPVGTRRAQFGERLSSPPIQTGTTSGEIRISPTIRRGGFDVTPDPRPITIIRIPSVAPTISDASATRTSDGVRIVLIGFSTPRSMDEAVLTFTARPGANVTGDLEVTVALSEVFSEWFASPESTQHGSRFQLTLPVNITGDPADITGVSIRLRNSAGASEPVSIAF